jgi:hypothetical protein
MQVSGETEAMSDPEAAEAAAEAVAPSPEDDGSGTQGTVDTLGGGDS